MVIQISKLDNLKNLRETGHSIPEISKILGLPKSSVSRHVKGIQIKSEFRQRWLDRRNASQIISERQQVLANIKAGELVPGINQQSLALMAAALYWAEGAKKDFSLTNSDPEMVRVFVTILKKVFKIKNEEIKISIRLYDDLIKKEAVNFWSRVVGVDLHNNVSINILKGKKNGKLKYGMCRVRIKKAGLLFKTIFAINKRVCEFISS